MLFDRKCLRPEMCENEVPGTMYGLSDSGCITSELFDIRLVHHFLCHVPAAHPLLLLLDGHSYIIILQLSCCLLCKACG